MEKKFLVKSLIKLRIINAWYDGDTVSFTWNYYNPLLLLILPFVIIVILAFILMEGVPSFWNNRSGFGFGLSPYWKEHRDQRIFIKPDMI